MTPPRWDRSSRANAERRFLREREGMLRIALADTLTRPGPMPAVSPPDARLTAKADWPLHHSLTQATLDLCQSEAEFTTAILELADLYGWSKELRFHDEDSKRNRAGFPDWVLVREQPAPRIVFVELKSEKGIVRKKQKLWLRALAACPGPCVHLWRPSDWSSARACLSARDSCPAPRYGL